jgi:hypothetical protein
MKAHFKSARWLLKSGVALMAGLMITAQAADPAAPVRKPAEKEQDKTPKRELPKLVVNQKAAKQQKVLITGSRIPERVEPGKPHVTANHVVVLGSKEIDRTGARTARQLMTRVPYTR